MSPADPKLDRPVAAYARRHLLFGWWSLLLFLTLGIVLESLHGLKVGWYLDVGNEARRLMWTLAHTHGTLLGLVHLAFAVTACPPAAPAAPWRRWASSCLIGASALLPTGFFLGGVFIYGGDPGLGVILVPVGGLLLWLGVFRVARGLGAGAGGVAAGEDGGA